jgi:hypothetical protein
LPESESGARRERRMTVLVIALLVLGMLCWALLAFLLVGDRPRSWEYGAAPYIPAESYSSTEPTPPAATAPKQVELPPPTIKKKGK